MKALVRFGIGLWIALLTLVVGLATSTAAAPPATCTADLFIQTTSFGDVSTSGNVTIARDSGVGGFYLSGFPAGYTLSGAQDIILNNKTNKAQIHGSFTAVDPSNASNTFTLKYNGHANLNTGAATGNFVTAGGTGIYADFHWTGKITAQLVGPLAFQATDTGKCHPAP